MPAELGVVWVVAGPPGAGKSTVASELISLLDPSPALLDKDTLFGRFVSALIAAYGGDDGVREGDWYDAHVKLHEYPAMIDAARQIRSGGCSVVLDAPFTGPIHDADAWARFVGELGGDPARLVWVRTDAATLRRRLEARGLSRDAGKLDAFEQYVERIRPGQAPAVPHLEIDNTDGAPPIRAQLTSALASQRSSWPEELLPGA